jgi:acyl-CoA synthetase (AMP-forming)/AMP-acid ligase II
MNIADPIFVQCRNKPAELALCAPGTKFNVMSYGRLAQTVNNACRQIISAGLLPGNRVAVFVKEPVLHAIVLIALARLGVVTLSGRAKDWSWRFSVDAVIADSPHNYRAAKIILLDENWLAGDGAPLDGRYVYRAALDDVCRIMLTSGTTGEEKGVAVTHRTMAARITRQDLFFGPQAPFCARTFLDLSLTTPLGFQVLLATLWRGGALVLTGDPETTLKALPVYKVQNMVGSPRSLLNFVEAIERRAEYRSGLEAAFCGGSLLSEALSERFRTRACSNLTMGYGSTEATMVAAMPAHYGRGIAGAVGHVLPGIAVEIVDRDDRALPAGKEGIVRIRSAYSAGAYLDDPEESARAFRGGWFYPGDLGYLGKDNLLVISGRATGVLDLGGEKISVERIEDVLSRHPNIVQCAVTAIAGATGIDQLCALVVVRSYLDVDALHGHCAANLPPAFVPTRFIAVGALPRNEMGKVERAKLPDLLRNKLN